MVFYGEARWHDHADDHGAHGDMQPHESPAIMLLPLVVLAGLSIIGGGINLPFSRTTERLATWLEPVLGTHDSDTSKVPLAVAATAIALVGIAAGDHGLRQAPRQADRADGARRGVVRRQGGQQVHGWPRSGDVRRRRLVRREHYRWAGERSAARPPARRGRPRPRSAHPARGTIRSSSKEYAVVEFVQMLGFLGSSPRGPGRNELRRTRQGIGNNLVTLNRPLRPGRPAAVVRLRGRRQAAGERWSGPGP